MAPSTAPISPVFAPHPLGQNLLFVLAGKCVVLHELKLGIRARRFAPASTSLIRNQ